MANSIAFLFIFGKVPGMSQCDRRLHECWAHAPNAVLSPQNNLLCVSNCACTSRPNYCFVCIIIYGMIGCKSKKPHSQSLSCGRRMRQKKKVPTKWRDYYMLDVYGVKDLLSLICAAFLLQCSEFYLRV